MDPKIAQEMAKITESRARARRPNGSGRKFLNELYQEEPQTLVAAMEQTLSEAYGKTVPGGSVTIAITHDAEENPAHPFAMKVQLHSPSRAITSIKEDEQFFRKMKRAYVQSLGTHPCGALRALEYTPEGTGFTLIHHDMTLMCGVLRHLAKNEACLGVDARLMTVGEPNPEDLGHRANWR